MGRIAGSDGGGRGFLWSNILFLKSDHVTPPLLQPIPLLLSVSPPSQDFEEISINSPIWLYVAPIRLRTHCHLACSTLGGCYQVMIRSTDDSIGCWSAALETLTAPSSILLVYYDFRFLNNQGKDSSGGRWGRLKFKRNNAERGRGGRPDRKSL